MGKVFESKLEFIFIGLRKILSLFLYVKFIVEGVYFFGLAMYAWGWELLNLGLVK